MNTSTEFWSQIDNDSSYEDLLLAIEYSGTEEVSLLIAVCDGKATQQQIIHRYQQQLQLSFHSYLLSVNSNNLMVKSLITNLIESEYYHSDARTTLVSVIGAANLASFQLSSEKRRSDLETFLGSLQWTREGFRQFSFPIVFWVTKAIYDQMSIETADFWSWRKGVFFFKNEDVVNPDFSNAGQLLQADDVWVNDFTAIPLQELQQLTDRILQKDPRSPLLITLYHSLSRQYAHQDEEGFLQLAIEYLERAVYIINHSASKSTDELSGILLDIADLNVLQNKYAEAKRLYEEILTLQRSEGSGHPQIFITLNKLADLRLLQGDLAMAETLYLESLRIQLQSHSNSSNVALVLNNLAALYKAQGKWEEAEPLYLEALKIFRQLFGNSANNGLAKSLNNLAELYRSQEKWEEAEPLYLEALKIFRQLFGNSANNGLATSLNNLAELYRSQGKWEEAELLYLSPTRSGSTETETI
jgi:tetratricopeptide (TPR) repeat protein